MSNIVLSQSIVQNPVHLARILANHSAGSFPVQAYLQIITNSGLNEDFFSREQVTLGEALQKLPLEVLENQLGLSNFIGKQPISIFGSPSDVVKVGNNVWKDAGKKSAGRYVLPSTTAAMTIENPGLGERVLKVASAGLDKIKFARAMDAYKKGKIDKAKNILWKLVNNGTENNQIVAILMKLEGRDRNESKVQELYNRMLEIEDLSGDEVVKIGDMYYKYGLHLEAIFQYLLAWSDHCYEKDEIVLRIKNVMIAEKKLQKIEGKGGLDALIKVGVENLKNQGREKSATLLSEIQDEFRFEKIGNQVVKLSQIFYYPKVKKSIPAKDVRQKTEEVFKKYEKMNLALFYENDDLIGIKQEVLSLIQNGVYDDSMIFMLAHIEGLLGNSDQERHMHVKMFKTRSEVSPSNASLGDFCIQNEMYRSAISYYLSAMSSDEGVMNQIIEVLGVYKKELKTEELFKRNLEGLIEDLEDEGKDKEALNLKKTIYMFNH